MSKIKDYYLSINVKKAVEIPEWSATVFVSPLTMEQYKQIQGKLQDDVERSLAIIQSCAKNEDGSRAFDDMAMREIRFYGTTKLVFRVAADITKAMPKGTFDIEGGADSEKKA